MSTNRGPDGGVTPPRSLGAILDELAGLLDALTARAARDGWDRAAAEASVEVWNDPDYLYLEGRHAGRPLEIDVSLVQRRIFVRARVDTEPGSAGPKPGRDRRRNPADVPCVVRNPVGTG